MTGIGTEYSSWSSSSAHYFSPSTYSNEGDSDESYSYTDEGASSVFPSTNLTISVREKEVRERNFLANEAEESYNRLRKAKKHSALLELIERVLGSTELTEPERTTWNARKCSCLRQLPVERVNELLRQGKSLKALQQTEKALKRTESSLKRAQLIERKIICLFHMGFEREARRVLHETLEEEAFFQESVIIFDVLKHLLLAVQELEEATYPVFWENEFDLKAAKISLNLARQEINANQGVLFPIELLSLLIEQEIRTEAGMGNAKKAWKKGDKALAWLKTKPKVAPELFARICTRLATLPLTHPDPSHPPIDQVIQRYTLPFTGSYKSSPSSTLFEPKEEWMIENHREVYLCLVAMELHCLELERLTQEGIEENRELLEQHHQEIKYLANRIIAPEKLNNQKRLLHPKEEQINKAKELANMGDKIIKGSCCIRSRCLIS